MPEEKIQKSHLATTIDEVIGNLDVIIDDAVAGKSRLGFFAVLYRGVTVKVKEGIGAGRFQDGQRMERLDVIFANRYLEALHRFQNRQQPTQSWLAAFGTVTSWRALILQHLLLGINAHINLDLGIAAAQTSPGDQIFDLRHDFNEINKILAGMLDLVQSKLGKLSPWFALFDYVGGRTDEAVINFSMQRARDAAWQVAERMAELERDKQGREIARMDENVARFAKMIRNPGKWLSLVALIIRIRETSDVEKIIRELTC